MLRFIIVWLVLTYNLTVSELEIFEYVQKIGEVFYNVHCFTHYDARLERYPKVLYDVNIDTILSEALSATKEDGEKLSEICVKKEQFFRKVEEVPTGCSKIELFNETHTLIIDELSFMYSKQTILPIVFACPNNKEVNHQLFNEVFKPQKSYHLNLAEWYQKFEKIILQREKLQAIGLTDTNIKPAIDRYGIAGVSHETILKSAKAFTLLGASCNDSTKRISVKGSLPTKCSLVIFCDEVRCTELLPESMIYTMLLRNPSDESMEIGVDPLKSKCKLKLSSRSKRAPLRNLHVTTNPLSFRIPGYRYCGPGTKIHEMDKLGGPLNQLDIACREHDIAYQNAKSLQDVWIADDNLISDSKELAPETFPLMYFFFKAKRLFEAKFNTSYFATVNVKFDSEKDHFSLLYNEIRTADRFEDEDERKAFELVENEWMAQLKNIWWSYCETSVSDKVPQQSHLNVECSDQGASLSQLVQHTIRGQSASVEENEPGRAKINRKRRYAAPKQLFPCNLLINEVKAGFRDRDTTELFVEVAKYCPLNIIHTATGTSGYYLVTGNVNEKRILGKFDLDDVITRNPITEFGTEDWCRSIITISCGTNAAHHATLDPAQLPVSSQSPIFVALIYVPPSLRKHAKRLDPGIAGHLDTNTLSFRFMEEHLTDLLLYGYQCNTECAEFMNRLWENFDVTSSMLPTSTTPEFPIDSVDKSLSRCILNAAPFQHNAFVLTKPTPGALNECKNPEITVEAGVEEEKRFPYQFQGKRLTSQTRKLVANLFHGFEVFGVPQPLSDFARGQAAAGLLNIGRGNANQIYNDFKSKSLIETPSKKQKLIRTRRCDLDSFDRDHVDRIIQAFYAKNIAPRFMQIYDEFRECKGNQFKCSPRTFRKVLRGWNFRYKTINKRAMLTERPAVKIRRKIFLRKIKKIEKENLENPLQETRLVYLDETWIDVSNRLGKAWMPRQFVSFAEMAKYSFKDAPPSGPRLIVLSAADHSGVIKESILVYQVAKKKASPDYHDNINTSNFNGWIGKLFVHLKTRSIEESRVEGKQIIYKVVLDNAPYHSSSTAPNLNARKQVLYEFLQQHQDKLTEPLPATLKDARVIPMRCMLREMKKKYSFYALEELAKQYDIEIIRTPPWNCDLNPIELLWNDVKFQVKDRNRNKDIKLLQKIAVEVLENYPSEKWLNMLEDTKKIREKYWEEEKLSEERPVTPFIINTSDDDEDEEDVEAEEELQDNQDETFPQIYDEDLGEDDPLLYPQVGFNSDFYLPDTLDMGELDSRVNYDVFHNQLEEDENEEAISREIPRTRLFDSSACEPVQEESME